MNNNEQNIFTSDDNLLYETPRASIRDNPWRPLTEYGRDGFSSERLKLPHGWIVRGVIHIGGAGVGMTFVPFAENGTGWGPDDSIQTKD